MEAPALAAKAIVDRFIAEGAGKGIALAVWQKINLCNANDGQCINMPIRIHSSEQTQLPVQMFAATAGLYAKVEDAMSAMGQGLKKHTNHKLIK